MKKNNVTTRVRYGGSVLVHIVLPNGTPWQVEGDVFHRIDYLEDGCRADWYGIELTRDQYKAIRKTAIKDIGPE